MRPGTVLSLMPERAIYPARLGRLGEARNIRIEGPRM
jgi:hypothetical protein